MAPDGLPPFVYPDADDFDSEAGLDRLARLIYSRRSGIAPADLNNWFDVNPSELDELESIKATFTRPPVRPPTWLGGGIRVFEVTESPEGEFVDRHGNHFAVLRSYSFNYVPNQKRRPIAPWAAFGQR